MRAVPRRPRRRRRCGGRLRGEGGEELVRQLLGAAFDQAGADLRQLAADLGIGRVVQDGGRAAVDRFQPHLGAALGEAGGAALALAGDGVAVGRIDVAQRHLAAEAGLDRADLGDDARDELGVGGLVQLLAAGDAGLQDVRDC